MTGHSSIMHEGIVTNVTDETIEVIIQNRTACSACHANGMCGMAGVKQKTVTIHHTGLDVKRGDRVMVYATLASGVLSVMMAYLIPSLWLVTSIAGLLAAGLSEIAAALISLILLGFYFFILYLCKDKIGKKIIFTVERIGGEQHEIEDMKGL